MADGKPPSHAAAQTEDSGLPDARVLAVLHEEGATEDAVHRDEWQKDAEGAVQRRRKLLDDHFHELHHRRDDRDEHDEAEEAQVDVGIPDSAKPTHLP